MRPNTSPMLQQNNNNNYPCLTAAGPGRALPPKCRQAALPFPTRLELGLADLPLIRGLRAWALCSRNRHKTGGLLGRAPMAPPANSGSRPADVYLSAEWGGYGVPLGLDGMQEGLGALVTVATLKTSEGSGKTQTQCLFLRTEKGSCLYPTAKPASVGTAPGSRGVVGGWLRGKTRGAQAPPSHTGLHRARERSGRRWRKSGNNTAGREKTCMSQQWQDEPTMTSTDEERQEEPHKRGTGCGQDIQETCKNPRSCQNASPQIRTPHSGQRRDSQGQHGQGESPRRGAPNGPRDELRGVKKQDKEGKKDSGSSSLAVTKPDLESNVTGLKEESTPELETKIIHYDKASSEKRQEAKDTEKVPDRTNNAESITAIANGISDQVEADGKRVERESVGLCGPPQTSDCVDSPAPVECSICKEKSEEAELGIVAQFCKCKHQESNCEDENVIVDDERTCTSPAVISEEKNMIHLLEMEVALTVSCGESLANQYFSTHANPKQTELSDETQQVKDADSETVKGLANTEITVKIESTTSSISESKSNVENRKYHIEKKNTEVQTNFADPSHTISPPANPALPPTPVDSMATGRPTLEGTEQEGRLGKDQRGPKVDKRPDQELDESEPEQAKQRVPSLDTETGHQLEDEGFGGFMQAEAQSGWSDKFNETHEYTNHKWSSPGGTHSCLSQSDDAWAVFPRDWTENREDVAGQWWPHSSVEDRGHTGEASLGLVSVFTAAFPSLPASSSCDPCDPVVLSLTQLLRGSQGHEGDCQDQGLLARFHDLNKMIGQRYKRASGVSRDLLLKTLHLEPPVPESRPGPSAAHRQLSPGLLSAYQHALNATVKRRLSYDYHRNIMD